MHSFNNIGHGNLGDFGSEIMGGLGGMSIIKLGHWNRLQQMQIMQAFQTITLLGIGHLHNRFAQAC
jgi:hypothetical protein